MDGRLCLRIWRISPSESAELYVFSAVRAYEGAACRSITSLLVLSDGLPSPLLSAMAQNIPQASLLGLITHATPFLTGRPYTLLRGGSVYESGAIGLAVTGGERWEVGVDYAGLEPLGEVVEIEG